MSKLIIGIDIGAKGGIAALYNNELTYAPLGDTKSWIDWIKSFKTKPELVPSISLLISMSFSRGFIFTIVNYGVY